MTLHRKLTREERTAVNRALDRWGAFDLAEGRALLVAEGEGAEAGSRRICIVSQELEQTVLHLQPDSAGLVMGELKKQFMPSMAGADALARFARSTGRDRDAKSARFYVRINDTAEKLVLYGRDVLGESILEAADDIGENELLILLNARGEAVGIGRTRFQGRSLFSKGRATITTLEDAGHYLRDEEEGRQQRRKAAK